jgi:tetratricopeptide (TPR) repeat protein
METRSQMVTVHRFRGRTKEMKAELEQLLPLLRAQARSAPLALVNGLKDDAHLAIDEGRYAAAVTSSKEAVDLAMARLGPAHLQTAASWQVYGLSLLFNRQPREALEATRLAHEMTLKIRGGNEGHPQVINSRASHARALAANGRLEDAIRELKRAIADAGETLGQRARIVGFFSQNLVRYQLDAGEVKDAIASSERATSVLAEHVQEDSSTFGATLNARGIAYLAAYDGARAIADLDKSLATARKILGPRHEATLRSAAAHAAALAMDGQAAAALEAVRALAGDPTLAATPSGLGRLGLLAMAARLSGDDELTTELLDRVTGEIRFEAEHRRSEVRWRIETGLHQVATGRPAEAERNFRSALADGVGHALAHSPETSEAQVGLARSLMYQGRAAEALPLLRQSDAFWRGFDSENRWAGEAAFWLAKCYAALGRDADAMQAYQRAVPILARSRLPGDAHLVKLARAR